MNKPTTAEEIGKRTLTQEERNDAANQDMARAAMNMTTEDMTAKLERDAKFWDDARTPEMQAMARRLTLLQAVADATAEYDGYLLSGLDADLDEEKSVALSVKVAKARAALDADERGGKDGK